MFVYPLLLDNESVHNHFHFQHLNNDNYIETLNQEMKMICIYKK